MEYTCKRNPELETVGKMRNEVIKYLERIRYCNRGGKNN